MKRFFKGAATLAVAGVLCKILGAIYRVPLTRFLGAEGLGAYQMAFPVYAALLTLSSTGIPAALSKTIAEGRNAEKVLIRSLAVFSSAGLVASAVMFALAEKIAAFSGNPLAANVYRALAPSVFFVSVISCLRGYYQGKKNMLPTALSQVAEQTVKLLFGLLLCAFFGRTPYEKAALATLSVTISEVFALAVIVFGFKREKSENGEGVSIKAIVSVVFPITLAAVMLPVSKLFDGLAAVNLIDAGKGQATALFGLYSGGAESIISLPVAACYAVAVAAIPEISNDKRSLEKRYKPILLTLLIGAITALLTYFSAKTAVSFLYGGLSIAEQETLVLLIKISAIQIVGLSIVQTLGAVLTASDKIYLPPLALLTGIIIKIMIAVVLVPSSYGIYGLAIADSCCYFTAALLEFVAVFALKGERAAKDKSNSRRRVGAVNKI